MDEVVLARHGESETSAQGIVGGDAPLTEVGRAQARELGARLRQIRLDICLTSGSLRTRETAELALADRSVPIQVDAELGEIGFGEFDGRPLDEYREWIASRPPTEVPPGGESRVDTLRRFAAASRRLLGRDEQRALVVAHGLTIRALLDDPPRPAVAGAPYGFCVTLGRRELLHAVERLELWCETPAW